MKGTAVRHRRRREPRAMPGLPAAHRVDGGAPAARARERPATARPVAASAPCRSPTTTTCRPGASRLEPFPEGGERAPARRGSCGGSGSRAPPRRPCRAGGSAGRRPSAPAAALSSPTYATRSDAAHVGDERDDRDAALGRARPTAAATAGSSGALSTTPWQTRPPSPRPSSDAATAVGRRHPRSRGSGPAPWPGAAPAARPRAAARTGVRKRAGASSTTSRAGSGAPAAPAVCWRSRSSTACSTARTARALTPGPSVEHPVDGRRRQAGLLRDVADPVAAADHPPIVRACARTRTSDTASGS